MKIAKYEMMLAKFKEILASEDYINIRDEAKSGMNDRKIIADLDEIIQEAKQELKDFKNGKRKKPPTVRHLLGKYGMR